MEPNCKSKIALILGHFYVHRRCALWSEKVKVKTIKNEDSPDAKKVKETETFVGVDQVCVKTFAIRPRPTWLPGG